MRPHRWQLTRLPIPGILQARTLEWVAISFSNAWKGKVKVKSLSRVRLLAMPWTAAYQAPPSMGFSRQEYWSGVPLRPEFNSWVGKISWRREWLFSPVFLLGEFHGQRILVSYSPWGYKESRYSQWGHEWVTNILYHLQGFHHCLKTNNQLNTSNFWMNNRINYLFWSLVSSPSFFLLHNSNCLHIYYSIL